MLKYMLIKGLYMSGYCSEEHGILYSSSPFVGGEKVRTDPNDSLEDLTNEVVEVSDDQIEEIVDILNKMSENLDVK